MMTYLNNIDNDTGLKTIVDHIRKRKNFTGETKHWIGGSLKHGVLNILPFNFVDDDLPNSVLEECFPSDYKIATCFKRRCHALLQARHKERTIGTLSAVVENKGEKTLVFNDFVVCSLSENEKFQALTIDEVAEVLEQLQLNPFISVVEVSRYY